MAELNPELRAAIDVAKQRVKVDTYYPKAMNSGLKGNGQGYFAGTFLGFLTGGIAGGLISLALTAASVVSPFIGIPLVLGLAGIGGTMGATAGARVGADAGIVAGVLGEKERREKADQLEQEILKSPAKQQEAIAAYRANPVVDKSDTIQEAFATSRTKSEAWGKVVDWKNMGLTIGVCALVSAALFTGTFLLAPAAVAAGLSGVSSGLGMLGMHTLGEAALIGAGAGGAMGVAFGVNLPVVFASVIQHVANFLSGKTIRGKTGIAPMKTVPEVEREAAQNRAISESLQQTNGLAPLKPLRDDVPSTQVSGMAAADRVATLQNQLGA